MKMTSKTLSLSNNASRRDVLGMGALLSAAALMPFRANAATQAQAEALILKVVGEVQTIINSGKSESAMISAFAGVFDRYANVTAIAATVLGPVWRSAPKAEQTAYVKAFRGYVSRKYGKQFRGFIGAKISVDKSTDFGQKGIIVNTTVVTSRYEPFAVEWHVVDRRGKLEFFDMIVEGVKLVSTERAEIRSILDRSGGSVANLAKTLNSMG